VIFKRVRVYGDSFTWGTDLKDALSAKEYQKIYNPDQGPREQRLHDEGLVSNWKPYSRKTWPILLANHLNLPHLNISRPGYSNQAIARRVLKSFRNHIDADTLVILGWTWINRWDFYDVHKNEWTVLRPSGSDNKEFNDIYFKYMQSELWDKWESLKCISLIHGILKQHNVRFIATCIDPLLLNKVHHSEEYIDILQDEMSADLTWFDNKGFYDWSKENNFQISNEGGHPLEEAHQSAFEYVKSHNVYIR
jgi:hypothetical protein